MTYWKYRNVRRILTKHGVYITLYVIVYKEGTTRGLYDMSYVASSFSLKDNRDLIKT